SPTSAIINATDSDFLYTAVTVLSWNNDWKCSSVNTARYGHSSMNGIMKITANTANTQRNTIPVATEQRMSLTLFSFNSTTEILLYRILYRSRNFKRAMLTTDGISMMIATTAPLLKFVILPSISLYSTVTTTSN